MKVLYMVFMILGCFMGAGFVSGREIACYFSTFGKYSIIGVVIAIILMFLLIYFFFQLSYSCNSFDSFVCAYFNKSGKVINWLFALCLFILSSSMFAGSLVIAETINVSKIIFALITAILAYLVVMGNTQLLKKINFILVPIIILTMFMVCVGQTYVNINYGSLILSILGSTNYVFMNIVTLGLLILETGRECTRKQALIVSAISSLIIGIILFVCNNAILANNLLSVPMPMLALATKKGFWVWIITAITIWIGLFTTVISTMFVLSNYVNKYIGNYSLTLIMLLVLTCITSTFGFDFLVAYVYWIIGIVGVILVLKVMCEKTRKIFRVKRLKY